MRCTYIGLIWAFSGLSFADGDTFGKTDAQILLMGENRWDAFYLGKAGNSTASMFEAAEIYFTAELHRNETLAKKSNSSAREKVLKLRKQLLIYGNSAVEIGSNLDGGGTMWIPVSAEVRVAIEEVLFGVLGGRAPSAKHVLGAEPTKMLALLENTIKKTHADKDAASYFKFSEAKASLAKMRTSFAEIIRLSKGLSRHDSDRIFGFCLNEAKMARGDWG